MKYISACILLLLMSCQTMLSFAGIATGAALGAVAGPVPAGVMAGITYLGAELWESASENKELQKQLEEFVTNGDLNIFEKTKKLIVETAVALLVALVVCMIGLGFWTYKRKQAAKPFYDDLNKIKSHIYNNATDISGSEAVFNSTSESENSSQNTS